MQDTKKSLANLLIIQMLNLCLTKRSCDKCDLYCREYDFVIPCRLYKKVDSPIVDICDTLLTCSDCELLSNTEDCIFATMWEKYNSRRKYEGEAGC